MKTTKNILSLILLITLLTFTSCNSSDDNPSNDKDHLNPPTWIQKTWTKPNALNGEDGFRFTSDNMFTVMYDQNGNQTVNLSYMDSIQDRDYNITEDNTNTTYQFSVHYNDTNSTETWKFELLANGNLQYTDNIQNTFEYTVRN